MPAPRMLWKGWSRPICSQTDNMIFKNPKNNVDCSMSDSKPLVMQAISRLWLVVKCSGRSSSIVRLIYHRNRNQSSESIAQTVVEGDILHSCLPDRYIGSHRLSNYINVGSTGGTFPIWPSRDNVCASRQQGLIRILHYCHSRTS